MPKSADMILLVFGAVLLAAGLFGGGTKIFSVEIPQGFGGRFARIAALVLGLMMLGAGLYLTVLKPERASRNGDAAMPSPSGSSKAFCLAIKEQWETKKQWSNQDDQALRESFKRHNCGAQGIALP